MTPPRSYSPLALIGVGYMGGSLALAARRAGLATHVVGYDIDADAGVVARQRGIVDQLAPTPELAVRDAALIVLAGPVGSLVATAKRIEAVVDAGALVIDIGSVKGPVVRALEATSLAARFVGCHPLAGLERSGPGAADENLYQGKPCFLCPGSKADAQAVKDIAAFWQGIGATIQHIGLDEHDAFMAAASHLPHVGAFAVAAALIDVADMLAATIPPSCPPTSLRDTTRVAASSPVVWRDIFLENRPQLLPLVRGLERSLGQLRAAIEAGDGAAIEAFLHAARACRKKIVKGGGG